MEHKVLQSKFKDLPPVKFRTGIQLKPWQRLAIAFLLTCREKYGFALVGDEMGVGKVIPPL